MRANDTWAAALRDLGTAFVAAMVVLGALGGVGGFVGGASAATVVVANGESIQAAVGVANAGDTIEIRPGTYDKTVTIDKPRITLNGPNAGTPGDSSARGAEARVKGQVIVEASGVRVDGLQVSPPDPVDQTSKAEAIRVSSGADDVTFANNIIKDFSRTSGSGFFGVDGINLFGGDEDDPVEAPTVRNNLVDGLKNTVSGGAAGISIQGNVVDPEVKQNTVRSIAQQETPYGFGIVVRGTSNVKDPSGVTVTNNDITDVLSDPNSQFAGVGIGVEAGDANAIDIRNNDISNTELLLEDKTGTFGLQGFASANTLDQGALLAGVGSASGKNVIFDSIQDAEDAADRDDRIDVLPGSYKEGLDVDVSGLTLSGPNAGEAGDSGSRGAEALITGGVVITKDDVTLTGVSVTTDGHDGVRIESASDGSAPSRVTIANSVIQDITGNKKAGNGVQIFFPGTADEEVANVAITGNRIANVQTKTGDTSRSDAIGINVLPRGNDIPNLAITDNVITDIEPASADRSESRAISIDTQFEATFQGTRGDKGRVDNALIRNNEISGLKADFARAINLFEDSGGSKSDANPIGPQDFEISQNTISDVTSEGDGLPSLSLFIGEYDDFGTSESVNDNILLAGVENFGGSSDTLVTTDNWWGATDGPSGSGFSGTGAKVLVESTTTVNPASVSAGSVALETPFIGTITDPKSKLTTVANANAGFTIDNKLGEPADGTLVLEIAGTEYVFQDALDGGELTSTASSSNGPTDIANTQTTGERNISVVGSSSTVIANAGTVRLVHEVQGIGAGYTLSSVPQPARIYTEDVGDITAWDNDNTNFESTTATVDTNTLITDAEALHKGQYFFGDTADARVGYDYLTDGESAIQVGAGGFETLDEGFHLIGSNYDTSSPNAPISLDRDLASVRSLPDTTGDYNGDEPFVAYDTVRFGELGGDETIGSFEAYWVYVDVGEDSETRVIKLARFTPSTA